MPRQPGLKQRKADVVFTHRQGGHRAAIPVSACRRHLHRPPQDKLLEEPLRLRPERHSALWGINALQAHL
jgi:hypothetical protein